MDWLLPLRPTVSVWAGRQTLRKTQPCDGVIVFGMKMSFSDCVPPSSLVTARHSPVAQW